MMPTKDYTDLYLLEVGGLGFLTAGAILNVVLLFAVGVLLVYAMFLYILIDALLARRAK